MRIAGNTALLYGVGTSTIILVIFGAIPKQLTAIFIEDTNDNIEYLAKYCFLLAGATQLFDAIRYIAKGALRGVQETRLPMYSGIFNAFVITVPLTFLLLGPANLDLTGAWIAACAGCMLDAGFVFKTWLNKSKLSLDEGENFIKEESDIKPDEIILDTQTEIQLNKDAKNDKKISSSSAYSLFGLFSSCTRKKDPRENRLSKNPIHFPLADSKNTDEKADVKQEQVEHKNDQLDRNSLCVIL